LVEGFLLSEQRIPPVHTHLLFSPWQVSNPSPDFFPELLLSSMSSVASTLLVLGSLEFHQILITVLHAISFTESKEISFTESKEVSFISVGTFREIKAIE
jgi:hypothetical protein